MARNPSQKLNYFDFFLIGLQLKAEQTVQVHLDKWREHLEKFAGEKSDEGKVEDEEDRVRIVLKRDARTLLGDEQMVVS